MGKLAIMSIEADLNSLFASGSEELKHLVILTISTNMQNIRKNIIAEYYFSIPANIFFILSFDIHQVIIFEIQY